MVFTSGQLLPTALPIEALDAHAAQPLYAQVMERLGRAIATGELVAGQLLPSERQLCGVFRVSRPTLRRAVDELVRAGRLMRVAAVGTFVADQRLHLGTSISFTDRVRAAGSVPSTTVISFGIVPPDPVINPSLRIGARERLLCLKRIRGVDRTPVMVQTSYLQARRFEELLNEDLALQSLYRCLLDRFGVQVHTVQETLRPCLIPAEEASQLGCEPESAGMVREFLASDLRGQPVEYCRAYVRGDVVCYRFILRLGVDSDIDMIIAGTPRPGPSGDDATEVVPLA